MQWWIPVRMATEVLVNRGAFIDKYVGDAVMALFNVPIRHDDHARRAIVAATELGTELKHLGSRLELPLQASVGIATGHARVGRLGSDDTKDYTAIGDVVNLAARLQGKASAGEILIDQESYVKHAADFPDARAEQVLLKGFREPVTAYRLHGDGATPLVSDSEETSAKHKTSLGAIIFGILGAPCAIATLIGPLARHSRRRRALWFGGRAHVSRSKYCAHPNSDARDIGCTREPLYSPAGPRAANGIQSSRPSQNHDIFGEAPDRDRARRFNSDVGNCSFRSGRSHLDALSLCATLQARRHGSVGARQFGFVDLNPTDAAAPVAVR